jgi:beta-lactam-binding protein with PASTA domain
VPEVVGLYKQKATDKVVAAGLVARFTPPPPLEPNNPYVAAVSPEEGTTVDGGSTVTMQLQPGPPP